MITAQNTKKCDHCEKDINLKYRSCPFCGGHQNEMQTAISPVCPRCETDLKVHISDGEEYDICPECGGIWLDKDEFYRATRERTVHKKVESQSEYKKSPMKGNVDYVPCVRCGNLMNRRNFGKISGVIIDRCSRHGVWLDSGELEKIQHFIADGGLDKVRDRDIAKNRAMIKDLATNVAKVDFTQKIIHFWNFKRWLFRGWR